MHEQTAIRAVVTQALECMRREGGGKVTAMEVVLQGGHLDAAHLRLYLETVARGTPAEGARLQVTWDPARQRCLDCCFEFVGDVGPDVSCPRCGGVAMAIDGAPPARLETVEIGQA